MRVLIAGGHGFLGTALRRALLLKGHSVQVLTRSIGRDDDAVLWDGRGPGPWTRALQQSDAVINACGLGLEHWPWTASRKRQFLVSRVLPGMALAEAIAEAKPRPRILIQYSGINRYGLMGDTIADETSSAGVDFLAQLTIPWEDSTRAVEALGLRRVIARNSVVLDRSEGLFPLMCLPARLFVGGRFGSGRQAVPWIHVADQVRAILFFLEHEEAVGAFNLVAPGPISNLEFMRAATAALKRPYWLHVPAPLMRFFLGEMSDMVLEGRASAPRRLLEAGFVFQFPEIKSATRHLLANKIRPE